MENNDKPPDEHKAKLNFKEFDTDKEINMGDKNVDFFELVDISLKPSISVNNHCESIVIDNSMVIDFTPQFDSDPKSDELNINSKNNCKRSSALTEPIHKNGNTEKSLNAKNVFLQESDNEYFNDYIDCFESAAICINILSDVLDCLVLSDLSAGSSDEYIPDSYESDDSSMNVKQKKKKLRSRAKNVVINESDEDNYDGHDSNSAPVCEFSIGQQSGENNSFWDREGMKNGRKNKPRKSEKETREERENRKILRNLGQAYITKKGKEVQERHLDILEPCKRFKCSEKVPEKFRKGVFKFYWNLGTYEKRRRFVSSCIDVQQKKSARLVTKGTRHREFSCKYVLRYLDKEYSVCKNCFLKILNETNKFVQLVRETVAESESRVMEDSRRGRTPSFKSISEDRLEEAKQHILSFPAYESHYGRSNTSRKFLQSHLDLTTMYELYVQNAANPVSKTIYSFIFKAQNLSFKVPSIDTCLKCDTLNTKIKYASEDEKVQLNTDLVNHQKAAQDVYDEKKSDKARATDVDKDLMVVTFDLQQCLPTPYLTTGAAFYKRQLWTYNLTIHDCVSNKAVCYMWHEAEAARGGNEIASCIYHFIMNYCAPGIKKIILYSDSCSGQNKNKFVIAMFLLAIKNSHVESIEHKFFIPGHTHMECDTDHALIEKAKKKSSMNIHHPRDWYQLVRSVSKNNKIRVQEMTQDDFLDFSSVVKGTFVARSVNTDKDKFLISEARIFKYTKDLFPKFMYKTNILEFKTVDYGRKRKHVPDYNIIPRCYRGPLPISVEKKADLLSLLPLIDVHSRQFYIDLKTNDTVLDIDPDLEGYEEDE